MIIILLNIFNFEEIKININKIINHFLYNIKEIFVCFKFRLKIYLNIISYLIKDIDHFDLL
jgi:hypothetical protein